MHRSSCTYDCEGSICEPRAAQSGNGSADDEHVRRLGHTTEQRAEFEEGEEDEKGILRTLNMYADRSEMVVELTLELNLEYSFPVNGWSVQLII